MASGALVGTFAAGAVGGCEAAGLETAAAGRAMEAGGNTEGRVLSRLGCAARGGGTTTSCAPAAVAILRHDGRADTMARGAGAVGMDAGCVEGAGLNTKAAEDGGGGSVAKPEEATGRCVLPASASTVGADKEDPADDALIGASTRGAGSVVPGSTVPGSCFSHVADRYGCFFGGGGRTGKRCFNDCGMAVAETAVAHAAETTAGATVKAAAELVAEAVAAKDAELSAEAAAEAPVEAAIEAAFEAAIEAAVEAAVEAGESFPRDVDRFWATSRVQAAARCGGWGCVSITIRADLQGVCGAPVVTVATDAAGRFLIGSRRGVGGWLGCAAARGADAAQGNRFHSPSQGETTGEAAEMGGSDSGAVVEHGVALASVALARQSPRASGRDAIGSETVGTEG